MLAVWTRRPAPWLVVFAALLAVQISPWWYPTPDTVLYLSAARSIALHHRFGTLGNAQLGFPPGYPLLISPAFLLGDHLFLVVSIIHWCLAVALMLGVYRWAQRCCPDGALLLTGLVMVNVSTWIHFRRALSELAFMTVLIWTVQSLDALRRARAARAVLARGFLAGVLLLLVSMIREVGLMVGVGFGLAALIDAWHARRSWPAAFVLTLLVVAPAAIAVVSFVRYDTAMKAVAATPIGTHLDGLASSPAPLGTQITEGLRLRISEVGRLLIPGMFNAYGRPHNWLDLNVLIYVPLFVLVGIGWWRLVRRHDDVLALTLPFYLLAYTLWPFAGGARYMLPMLPVLWASVWYLVEPFRRLRLSLLAVLLIGHLAVALGHWFIKDLPRARDCNARWNSVDEVAARMHSDASVLLAPSVPQCVQLMLELRLDRLVALSSGAETDRRARWLLLPDTEPVAPGFSVALRTGPYTLLQREPDR
jgi:hypothetical protein